MKKPFIMILAFVLLCAGMLGFTGYAFWDTATESQRENRLLAELPTMDDKTWLHDWFSGSFAEAFESFLNDHVYKRDVLIDAAQRMEGFLEKEMEIKLVSTGTTPDNGSKKDQQTGRLPQDTAPENNSGEKNNETLPPAPTGETVDGGVVILNDRILTTYFNSEKNIDCYVEAASAFFDLFPDYVTKVNMLVPTRIAFEEPAVASICDSQKEAIQEVYSRLDPMIYTVDAHSALEANSTVLDDIYFRTDHHWTHYGAYLGAKAIFDTLEQDFVTIDHYQKSFEDTFLGYLYAQHPSESLKQHKDQLICYFPEEHPVLTAENHKYDETGNMTVETAPILDPSRSGYYSFAARNYAWLDIQGANPQGPSVLLVGDSYCNALCTWIAENASRVVLIDPRDYNLGKEGIMELYTRYRFSEVFLCDYVCVLESSYFIGKIGGLTE